MTFLRMMGDRNENIGLGITSAKTSTRNGAKPVHPLGATYFSQTPFRFGDYIAKFQLVPVSNIKDYADETINATGGPMLSAKQ